MIINSESKLTKRSKDRLTIEHNVLIQDSIDKLNLTKLGRKNRAMSKQKNSTGMFIGGLMIGSAVGAAIGLLIAPRTGKETRKVLRKSADALPEIAEDLSTSLQLQAGRLSESTLENWEVTLIRLRQAIAAGIEASRQTSQAAKSKITQQNLNSSISARGYGANPQDSAYQRGNRL